MIVREFWERTVIEKGESPFLYYEDKTYTYLQFDCLINKLANALFERGIQAGTKVALLFENSPMYLQCMMAIQKLGAIAVPMIAGSTFEESSYILNHSETTYLITDKNHIHTIKPQLHELKTIQQVFLVNDSESDFESLEKLQAAASEADPPPIFIKAMDPMGIFYTSGSTGKPKGVVLPNICFYACGVSIAKRLEYEKDDVLLCTLPLFHVGGLHESVAPAIACGCAVSLVKKFSASRFWSTVEHHQVTKALLLPTMMSILLNQSRSNDPKVSPLKLVFSHIRSQEFIERFGVDIATIWAQTELGGMGTLSAPYYQDYSPQMIGWPFPDNAQIKIIDEQGQTVPPNTKGEIVYKHPFTMIEYYKNPEETQKTIQNGWIRSGDIGRMDEQGRVFYEGRLKNVIKRSGENISGEEVEFCMMSHPQIQECMVFGIPDPIRTEEAVAIIVLRELSTVTEEELIDWCKQKISDWKIPRYIKFQSKALPKLANGKIDRVKVKDLIDLTLIWDKQQIKQ